MRSVHSCNRDRSHDAQSERYSPSRIGVIASLLLFCLAALTPCFGRDRDAVAATPVTSFSSEEIGNTGKEINGAIVRQSVEFGGRIVNLNGSGAMYDTLVNEHSGPRLLNQSLSIETLPDTKGLFDTLYLNSFGWGGDPTNAMRLRIDKRGVYRFNFSFRRNKNFYDYNLLANPLNTDPAQPVVDSSPHAMALTRRMWSADLLIRPQHTLSFVLGWSRVRNEGPSFSSVHANRVDALLDQYFSTTWDDFRMGVNWRIVPKTTLSFLESLQLVKNDTRQTALDPLNPYLINPTSGRSLATYMRTQPFSVYIPTENVTLTSHSIRNLEFTAHAAYSNADGSSSLSEMYTGTASGGGPLVSLTDGMSRNTWVTNTADASLTYHINPHLRFVDSFRYHAYRIPGYFAEISGDLTVRHLQQQVLSNESTFQYDFTRNVGVRAGYRWRNISDDHTFYECGAFLGTPGEIDACMANPATLDENESETINHHTLIAGVWYRLGRKLRATGEYQLTSADNYFVRIDPRREQRYRGNVSYMPLAWLNLGAHLNFIEQRNATEDFAYNAHSRNVGFTLLASPNSRLTFETDYEFTNTGQDANVCIPSYPGFSTLCAFTQASFVEVPGFYHNETHYGNANVIFKPVHRVTASVGYSVVRVDGDTFFYDPGVSRQPLGPLSYFYHRPSAMLAVQLCKDMGVRARWNYYQYNEYGGVGLAGSVTQPQSRYFHANVTTLSAIYSF